MLEMTWFLIWGLLWGIYFLLDGFDFGIGMMMPFIAKNNNDKRIMYNAMGPFWDGNEVWLITAGGVTFAAFPGTYAVMFSTLYLSLFILLFGLILRGVAFEFRGKVDNPIWHMIWDWCLILGSFVPALLLGVVFANIFKGVPFDTNGIYHGTFFTLLNPYGIIGGLLFVIMFIVHGNLWLLVKTPKDTIHKKAEKVVGKLWFAWLILAVLLLGCSWWATKLWENYVKTPILILIPGLAIIALLLVMEFIRKQAWLKAWFSSAVAILFTTMWGIVGLYPRLYPSSLTDLYSKTIANSASSPMTLKIMLVVVIIFVPLIIVYQSWVYKKFSYKITDEELKEEGAY
jgi:cytochrome bd ubiquinol oxidase subunit II